MTLRNASECKEHASQLRVELDNTVSRYLQLTGWKYTCNTPGSYWYWQKTLPDGRIVLANQASAIQMQEYLDNFP